MGRPKRGPHRVEARPHSNADSHPAGDFAAALSARLFVPIEQAQPLAVQKHFELLAPDVAEGLGPAHVTPVDRGHFDLVLAVGGKLMSNQDAAPRPERQTLDMVILCVVFRQTVEHLHRRRRLGSHCQTADCIRCRQIRLQQGRR